MSKFDNLFVDVYGLKLTCPNCEETWVIDIIAPSVAGAVFKLLHTSKSIGMEHKCIPKLTLIE